jgi:UDP-N-acetylglucosamine diphosphorylase/glucosamine-1-phosphate N-acetyltransferase
MNVVLGDFDNHKRFLPLTFTRPVADIRCGIFTFRERWEFFLKNKISILTQEYLQKKYPTNFDSKNIIINPLFLPDKELVELILSLKNEKLVYNNKIIAYTFDNNEVEKIPDKEKQIFGNPFFIEKITDIFTKKGELIKYDFDLFTKGRNSAGLSSTNIVFGKYPVFVEEGCFVECTTLNTNEGPIYLGKNSVVMEGANIRGPFALCEDSEVKMGAKIYSNTTIGPVCKVGGEINNSVFFGFSNIAHDGFLGNSIIGEWCILGADTNNSNLKNNYAEVKIWSYEHERFVNSGLQFCGLIMGDHSKSGINTMFNTGTVVGVSSNIFGAGFPRNFIPSFSWGGYEKMTEFKLNSAFDVMEKVMSRRNVKLSDVDKEIFSHIFNITASYRRY